MTHVFVLLVLVIVCFIYDLILIPFRFKRYSFIINSDSLIIIRRGIIKIKTVILAKQIYAMERRSNPMLKKFKLEKLVFVTMGKEFELTGISTDDALEMYNYFLKVKNGKII
jgi:membrane protein YdbS with pleckstrin-like domain